MAESKFDIWFCEMAITRTTLLHFTSRTQGLQSVSKGTHQQPTIHRMTRVAHLVFTVIISLPYVPGGWVGQHFAHTPS